MDTLDYKGFSYNMINKFFPTKRLSILAGFSSVGKTTFATNLGNWLCKNGKSVIYFSLAEQGKYIYDILEGKIGEKIIKRENGYTSITDNNRFFVCDIPGLSLEEIQLAVKNHNPDVIILDYLQLIEGSKVLRCVGRDFELKHLLDSLSELARLYNNRIIAISELFRPIDWNLSPSFEQSFPCRLDKYDRLILSLNLVVIHGKYRIHMANEVQRNALDSVELIKYFMRSDDADPVPTSYSFSYE